MSETSDRESAPKGRDVATAKSGRERPPELPDADVFTFGPVAVKASALEPRTAAVQPIKPATPSLTQARDGMFDKLVAAEDDVPGLVAYGIYKHSKRDWLAAFEQVHTRAPDANEVRSFVLGETTSRRVATYRHLAENMIAAAYAPRTGAVVERKARALGPAAAANDAEPAARPPVASPRLSAKRQGPSLLVIVYLAVLILFLVGLVVFVRSGLLPLGLGSR